MSDPNAPVDTQPALPSVKASRLGYGVAVVLLLAGVGVWLSAVLPGRAAVREAVEGLQRVMLPAGGEFTVEGAGTVTLYYEKRSRIDGKDIATPLLWDGPEPIVEDAERRQRFAVEPWTSGVEVPLPLRDEDSKETPGEAPLSLGSVIYQVPPYVGESLGVVELPSAGTYALRPDGGWTATDAGASGDTANERVRVVAVGHVPVELLKSGVWGVYGGSAVLGIAFTAAVVIALVTWARRHPVERPRRRAAKATVPADLASTTG